MEILKKLDKECIKYMNKIKRHRCRAKTGNWCLDCEIANATGTGILIAKKIIETSHNSDFKAHKSSPKVCPRCNGKGGFDKGMGQALFFEKCTDCGGSGKAS